MTLIRQIFVGLLISFIMVCSMTIGILKVWGIIIVGASLFSGLGVMMIFHIASRIQQRSEL